MSIPVNPPSQPTIPLTPEARAAYQDLYDKYETAIENTTDPGILQALNDSQSSVDNILTKDSMYRLHANTALFEALLSQINDTNNDLKKLKNEIAAIASHIATAGEILAAINKVLTLVPGV
ncbi:hypothetical protein H7849_15355 [Alloacidobacterium dinghuense]|uniref:Uncharacterized protein n=1 Tax=Alloacidobacterium dinghuense TaxID=2763107 RepID=A0A7G8BD99_9BACT|nr:hypothetical protein [Alloacidobacterium dinghuense]QNI30519.1 hypothetical protein H7849_15355 [Alloacidobacterium dinghuense]